ncbi:MAG: type III secretion inner membrane ring lipoprotein SctJ [Chlamydiota bacterium]
MKKSSLSSSLFFIFAFLFLTSCSEDQSIVNNIDERDANEIIVFLSSKGLSAHKIKVEAGETGAGVPLILWNISVPQDQSVLAMSILNHFGLPRKKGKTLLELFAKEGLMTTDREETVRYQAGLEEELKNIIRKIDGILDAEVQISFPPPETQGGEAPQKIKAAVYIKHQGVLDDPNNHLETKIKRLISGSIDNLGFENVSVISDRARFSDIDLQPQNEKISGKAKEKDYVSIWSVVMTKGSSKRFQFIFFTLLTIILGFGAISGWLIYKFYPHLRKKEEKKPEEPN